MPTPVLTKAGRGRDCTQSGSGTSALEEPARLQHSDHARTEARWKDAWGWRAAVQAHVLLAWVRVVLWVGYILSNSLHTVTEWMD